ncbi:hypothetical protein [Streptomyces sp. PH10-H1]|uniref:hypothetical protein n=1 Tax=Streptomyces sp. PH10-H1 TaxID=3046212 RepID=UPI0024B879B4|nr:hypothetical protein [Streptomyces sp. PH10-H1]MDJ0346272.1 hypothetical protein [Streptomyces sp. PH10-H1]
MTAPGPRPGLKSFPTTPDQPGPAEPARAPSGSGAPKVVAEGVRTAVVPDPHTPTDSDPRLRVVAVLHVIAPSDRKAIASGRSWCECGYQRQAVGRANTEQLILAHKRHQAACPLINPQAVDLDARDAA